MDDDGQKDRRRTVDGGCSVAVGEEVRMVVDPDVSSPEASSSESRPRSFLSSRSDGPLYSVQSTAILLLRCILITEQFYAAVLPCGASVVAVPCVRGAMFRRA